MDTGCSVYIVDSDARVRQHLVKLLRAQHYKPTPFATGSDFVEALGFLAPGISLIDLRLYDRDGMDLLRETRAKRLDIIPIVTAAGADIRTAVQAIKGGAEDFLEKPIEDEVIIQVLARFTLDLVRRIDQYSGRFDTAKKLSTLTEKELNMMISLLQEKDNGKVAERFHISVRTVESYRTRIMKKVGVKRFSDALLLLSETKASPAISFHEAGPASPITLPNTEVAQDAFATLREAELLPLC